MKKQVQQVQQNNQFPPNISSGKEKTSQEDLSQKNIEIVQNLSKSQNEYDVKSLQVSPQQCLSKIDWNEEEQLMLIQKHRQIGNKWALISQFLNGKNDNCVKNHFYSRLRKMIRKLNRIIQIYFKKSFKTIPNATIYKFVEASEQRFKQKPNCSNQVSMSSQDVISRMLKISVKEELKPQQSLGVQKDKLEEYRELIQQIYRANKNYKKKSKKIKNSTIKAPIRTKKTHKLKKSIIELDEDYGADESQCQSEKQPFIPIIPKNKPKFQHDIGAYEQEQFVPNVSSIGKKVEIKEGDQMQQLLKNIGLLHQGIKPTKDQEEKSDIGNQSIRSYSDFENPSQGLSFLEDSNNCWKKESRMFNRINKRLFGGSGSQIEGL